MNRLADEPVLLVTAILAVLNLVIPGFMEEHGPALSDAVESMVVLLAGVVMRQNVEPLHKQRQRLRGGETGSE